MSAFPIQTELNVNTFPIKICLNHSLNVTDFTLSNGFYNDFHSVHSCLLLYISFSPTTASLDEQLFLNEVYTKRSTGFVQI